MSHLAFGRKLSRQIYAEGKGREGGGWEVEEEEGLERVGGARGKRKGRSERWCQPLLLSKNIWKSFTLVLTHSTAQRRPNSYIIQSHTFSPAPANTQAENTQPMFCPHVQRQTNTHESEPIKRTHVCDCVCERVCAWGARGGPSHT